MILGLAFFFLLYPILCKGSTNCSDIVDCQQIQAESCGWCWDVKQALPGSALGPSDGECHQWTWFSDSCYLHVFCELLPDCSNVLGTDCGWCVDDNEAHSGDHTGPFVGSCKQWVWDALSCPVQYGPQQLHLSYGESQGEMVLTWATQNASDTVVYYNDTGITGDWKEGERQALVDSARAELARLRNEQHQQQQPRSDVVLSLGMSHRATGWQEQFGAKEANPGGAQWIHRAVLKNLIAGHKYTYFVASNGLSSEVFSFQAMRTDSAFVPYFLVFGDLGRYGNTFAMPLMQAEIESGAITAAVHVGDFAYDLVDQGGLNGDNFLNSIQGMGALVPYMTCPGNHEVDHNFSHYRHRFTMPGSILNDGYNMWFSWNAGLIHWISYSTEIFFYRKQDIPAMKAWLKADLAQANLQRDAQPWVIAYGHRPMYCSNIDGDDCTTPKSVVRAGLESIFYEGGVDVIIEAHEHSVERLWPVYNETVTQKNYMNPLAPVHLITGAAGCNEHNGACFNVILGPRGPWSAFRSSKIEDEGYAHLYAPNATHLYWEEVIVKDGSVEDSIWITQSHHGPFSHAPSPSSRVSTDPHSFSKLP